MRLADLTAELADLVLPRRCVGCERPGAGLCGRCAAPAPPVTDRVADLIGVPLVAAAPYQGGLRSGVLAFKERGRRDLAAPLAGLLAGAVLALDPDASAVLVPMPSTPAARRARGMDHVAVLARRAGRRCGLGVTSALVQTRATADSAGLDAGARYANVDGALAAAHPSPGRVAIVVDDVVTTGATLAEAIRALRAAGWPVCGAAAVAATPRRRPTATATGPGNTESDW